MTAASIVVAVALVTWTGLAFALARRAENGVSRTTRPSPMGAIAVALVLGAIAVATRSAGEAALCGIACIALVAAAGPDARTGFLFDALTFPTAVIVIAIAITTGSTASAAGGVAVLVGTFGTIVVASRGRFMGLGDVKAMYAIGAAFGPLESMLALFAASLSGCCAVALAGRAQRGAEVRFGPHLAVGAAVALIAGDPIVHHVMGL